MRLRSPQRPTPASWRLASIAQRSSREAARHESASMTSKYATQSKGADPTADRRPKKP